MPLSTFPSAVGRTRRRRRRTRGAGLAKRLTTHGLRHTFASHLVMRGVQLVAVQELLGHATIAVTQPYAHLAPRVTREAVKLLDSRPRGAPVERQ